MHLDKLRYLGRQVLALRRLHPLSMAGTTAIPSTERYVWCFLE